MSDDPFVDDPSLDDAPLPADAKIKSVSELAIELRAAEAEVYAATDALKRALATYHRVAGVDLPRALMDAGASTLTTTDGAKVELKTAYDTKQLTEPAGLTWVETHGGSALIKTSILVELDRGDLPAARELLELIRQSRHANKLRTLALTESVHPQTLGAFVRRRVEAGDDPPLETLGVHRRVYAQLGGRRPKSIDLKGFVR